MNLLIEQTKQKILNIIVESKLPISIIELILRDILVQVNELKNQTIQEEMKQLKEEESSEEEQ